MSKVINMHGIDFIDSTLGEDGERIYVLADEQSASTVGVFTSPEALEAGIESLREMGRTTQDIWGSVYTANAFMPPSFSM